MQWILHTFNGATCIEGDGGGGYHIFMVSPTRATLELEHGAFYCTLYIAIDWTSYLLCHVCHLWRFSHDLTHSFMEVILFWRVACPTHEKPHVPFGGLIEKKLLVH